MGQQVAVASQDWWPPSNATFSNAAPLVEYTMVSVGIMRTHSPMPSERRRLLCIYARALLASCLLLYSAMAIGHLGSTLSSPLSPWSRLRGSRAASSDPPPLDGYEARARDACHEARKSCRLGTAGKKRR
ncbi:unnamed protein product [Miscanthus lutarioriparius]|uniref:Uncharacterized protein n=1 Tax=Miscanthus lutarioriparius TaxID=422564 RepID=A0A811RMQ3_9POAL|nr:unnamed protein product [Miscanthus lutarioriparius]